jgi:hypothetical protein
MEYDSDNRYYSDDSYSDVSFPGWSESEDDDEYYYFEYYYLNETYKKKWFITMFVCLLIGVLIGYYL